MTLLLIKASMSLARALASVLALEFPHSHL